MKEKDFQRDFGKWITGIMDNTASLASSVFELKICKGSSIRFDAVREHQVDALNKAKHGSLYHKLTDMPHFKGMTTRFDSKKPFDCFIMCKVNAWIVIWKYVRGTRKGQREMVFIDIDDWMEIRRQRTKKSIKIEELMTKGVVYKF